MPRHANSQTPSRISSILWSEGPTHPRVSALSRSQFDLSHGRTDPRSQHLCEVVGPRLTEDALLERADAMVSTGLRDAGYTYFNLDDGWAASARDPTTSELGADPVTSH